MWTEQWRRLILINKTVLELTCTKPTRLFFIMGVKPGQFSWLTKWSKHSDKKGFLVMILNLRTIGYTLSESGKRHCLGFFKNQNILTPTSGRKFSCWKICIEWVGIKLKYILLLFLVGWDEVHLVLQPLLVYCTSSRW
jgi:hypothetical protein